MHLFTEQEMYNAEGIAFEDEVRKALIPLIRRAYKKNLSMRDAENIIVAVAGYETIFVPFSIKKKTRKK